MEHTLPVKVVAKTKEKKIVRKTHGQFPDSDLPADAGHVTIRLTDDEIDLEDIYPFIEIDDRLRTLPTRKCPVVIPISRDKEWDWRKVTSDKKVKGHYTIADYKDKFYRNNLEGPKGAKRLEDYVNYALVNKEKVRW